MNISLTNREADIMRVLWDHGPSVVTEVRDELDDELAYTTVLTILRTLETKGYVGHEEEGRGHRYFARVEQQAARTSALQQLKHKLFKGSAELLCTHLVADQKLSGEQLRRCARRRTRGAAAPRRHSLALGFEHRRIASASCRHCVRVGSAASDTEYREHDGLAEDCLLEASHLGATVAGGLAGGGRAASLGAAEHRYGVAPGVGRGFIGVVDGPARQRRLPGLAKETLETRHARGGHGISRTTWALRSWV